MYKIIIRSRYIVDCKIYDGPKRKHRPLSISLENLKLKYTRGDITKSTAKKVKQIVETYLTAITIRNVVNHRAALPKRHMPVFITLTYPSVISDQNDNELKRRHLGEFTKWLVRTKKCAAYVWRAETQKNGNLHFHIFTDKYMHYLDVRAVWNAIIGKDGYIAAFEKKIGHTNPNSTDIQHVRDVVKAAAYITKYFTKVNKKDARDQKGRKSGMSDNLRHIKPYSELNYDREFVLRELDDAQQIIKREALSEYVSIYTLANNIEKSLYLANRNVLADYEKYYTELARGIGLC